MPQIPVERNWSHTVLAGSVAAADYSSPKDGVAVAPIGAPPSEELPPVEQPALHSYSLESNEFIVTEVEDIWVVARSTGHEPAQLGRAKLAHEPLPINKDNSTLRVKTPDGLISSLELPRQLANAAKSAVSIDVRPIDERWIWAKGDDVAVGLLASVLPSAKRQDTERVSGILEAYLPLVVGAHGTRFVAEAIHARLTDLEPIGLCVLTSREPHKQGEVSIAALRGSAVHENDREIEPFSRSTTIDMWTTNADSIALTDPTGAQAGHVKVQASVLKNALADDEF